ncbi:NAD(P)H-dependent oxidoreductase [Streptomyces cyaneofuscatus]|uniref:NAD(P)H-dependent oxidoreductase n=1 Tax=Streptomyces cyaneofuscatus TaxID=66883 RepID=UPI002D7A2D41|nr:NAD(P)H-dependent oxidoreductase [Streptomyces cyaneofuscatus]WRO14340.1 NAD(P)H-dependent oxidoreductase [Streptomyces cyaneofuscatus]
MPSSAVKSRDSVRALAPASLLRAAGVRRSAGSARRVSQMCLRRGSEAAYSGLLKSLLDLLPQYALTGKTVLPLATGGSTAHVLAIDYALGPVVTSMGAAHVVPGWFTLDKDITVDADGTVALAAPTAEALGEVTDRFSAVLRERTELQERTAVLPAPSTAVLAPSA